MIPGGPDGSHGARASRGAGGGLGGPLAADAAWTTPWPRGRPSPRVREKACVPSEKGPGSADTRTWEIPSQGLWVRPVSRPGLDSQTGGAPAPNPLPVILQPARSPTRVYKMPTECRARGAADAEAMNVDQREKRTVFHGDLHSTGSFTGMLIRFLNRDSHERSTSEGKRSTGPGSRKKTHEIK